MVSVEDKDLFQILVAEFRYAVRRDNHLAPDTCVRHIQEYLPKMAKQWRAHTARQLTEEIIDERLLNSRHTKPDFKFDINSFLTESHKEQLNEDYTWESLLVFLTNYLESLPYNVDRYMEFIYGHMTYSEGIDYYSADMYNKILINKEKD